MWTSAKKLVLAAVATAAILIAVVSWNSAPQRVTQGHAPPSNALTTAYPRMASDTSESEGSTQVASDDQYSGSEYVGNATPNVEVPLRKSTSVRRIGSIGDGGGVAHGPINGSAKSDQLEPQNWWEALIRNFPYHASCYARDKPECLDFITVALTIANPEATSEDSWPMAMQENLNQYFAEHAAAAHIDDFRALCSNLGCVLHLRGDLHAIFNPEAHPNDLVSTNALRFLVEMENQAPWASDLEWHEYPHTNHATAPVVLIDTFSLQETYEALLVFTRLKTNIG